MFAMGGQGLAVTLQKVPALGWFCQRSFHPCSPSCSSNRLTLPGSSAPLVFPPWLLQQTQIFRAGKAYACSLSVMPQAPPGALPASPGMDQLGQSNMCQTQLPYCSALPIPGIWSQVELPMSQPAYQTFQGLSGLATIP